MQNPKGYKYTMEHEWISVEGDNPWRVGLTWYAQDMLSDLVYVKLPAVGAVAKKGKKIGEVESVKAVAPIYSPTNGEVTEINKNVKKSPQLVNKDPYGKGWLFKLTPIAVKEMNILMDSDSYSAYVATLTDG